jgi:hypothetical protein
VVVVNDSKRIALFLGAGFSHEFGMPLVKDLTEELKTWLTAEKFIGFNKNWRSERNGYSDQVRDRFLSLIQSPLHYEAILGALEVEADRPENVKLRQEYHGLRGWLLDIIYLLLHQRLVLNSSYIKSALKFHRGILHLMESQKPLWIFSLNHDLIVEMLADEYKQELRNGFSSEEVDLCFDTKRTTKARFNIWRMSDPKQAGGTFFPHGSPGTNLLKIHGSLDIFGFRDLDEYLCIQPVSRTVEGHIEALNKLDKIYDLPKANEEIIVLDSVNEMQFLRKSVLSGAFKFRKGTPSKVPKMTLDLFKSYVNYAEELLVMGYGFGDDHINRIMRDWLEFTSKRKMKIVDPFRKSIPSGFEHLANQVELIRRSSLDYLLTLPGGELSTAEKRWVKLKRFVRSERGKKISRYLKYRF